MSHVSKWDRNQSPMCIFCTQVVKTMVHIFYECEHMQKLWKALQSWLRKSTKSQVEITLRNILFLDYDAVAAKFVNMMLLIFKQRIYAQKCKGECSAFIDCMTKTVDYYKMEKTLAY